MIRIPPSDLPAQWLLAATPDWWNLVRFGPPGFDVHARVSFGESDDADGELPALRKTLSVLTRHTSTAHSGYAAVWEGVVDLDSVPTAPRVQIPNRTMLLFAGPIDELRDAPKAARHEMNAVIQGDHQEPHLVWPEDRAWFVACEVDEEIEFSVGCSMTAYQDLEQSLPRLVRQVSYGDDIPLYKSGRR